MENDYTEFIDRLCNEYGEALYQYAARRIHNPEVTKDLVQEVFFLRNHFGWQRWHILNIFIKFLFVNAENGVKVDFGISSTSEPICFLEQSCLFFGGVCKIPRICQAHQVGI